MVRKISAVYMDSATCRTPDCWYGTLCWFAKYLRLYRQRNLPYTRLLVLQLFVCLRLPVRQEPAITNRYQWLWLVLHTICRSEGRMWEILKLFQIHLLNDKVVTDPGFGHVDVRGCFRNPASVTTLLYKSPPWHIFRLHHSTTLHAHQNEPH